MDRPDVKFAEHETSYCKNIPIMNAAVIRHFYRETEFATGLFLQYVICRYLAPKSYRLSRWSRNDILEVPRFLVCFAKADLSISFFGFVRDRSWSRLD
jgi:hypothetical protein